MDPGTLHAVLSHKNSAIAGWEYVDANWQGTASMWLGRQSKHTMENSGKRGKRKRRHIVEVEEDE